MNIKNKILFLLNKIGLKTTDSLYIKQQKKTLICYPISIHNMYVYLGKIPPSLRKLKKICNYIDDTGTYVNKIPIKLFEKEFNLKPTHHSKLILNKGGLLYIKNGVVGGSHVIFCHPDKDIKKTFVCINFGSNFNKIIKLNYEEMKEHFVKFEHKPNYRGFYLNQ